MARKYKQVHRKEIDFSLDEWAEVERRAAACRTTTTSFIRDRAINSLDELLQALEERSYEIKRGKYISVKAPGQERFVRTKTLGEEYTEESLNTRIMYRKMGTGETPAQDKDSLLRAAYVSILGDVRILAEHNKKTQRKYDKNLPYSADNDLDVYHLSAQLSVISKDKISSIGELEGRISRLKAEYEKQRLEINNHIE